MKKLLYIGAIPFIIACGNKPNQTTENQEKPKSESAFSIDNLDTSAIACDNFWQYSIGGWLKDNPVPSTESRWSSFNTVVESNNTKLKIILEECANKKSEKGTLEQQVGDFYTSLMDSTLAEKNGIEPLRKYLSDIENATDTDELIRLSAELRKIGVSNLFGIYIGQDDKNSDKYITHIYQSGLGLPDRDYYLNTDEKSLDIQESYKIHISKIFELAGIENFSENSLAVYNLEKGMAKVSMTRVERRDPDKTYNKLSVDELNSLAGSINWENYFTTIGLNKVDEVIVSQIDFVKGINGILTSTELEDWKNYFQWHLINSYASSLSSAFDKQNFDFYGKTLSGKKEMKPRWKRSLSKINGNLGELLGKAFVERHFSEESKEMLSQMVENLREVFKERINKLDWMSEETKEKALEKLASFNKKIGYPNKWRDFSALVVSADDPVMNLMNAKKINFAYNTNKLGKEVDREEWGMSPQTVNAYYSSSKNEIVFPAGILQPPFYNKEADDAINYGGIGAVIGHEFTHGFDDQGSKYDSKGNLENWWTDEDRERFEIRANKVVDQFNGFEAVDSLFVNGKLTLGENIADLGGATMAFYALEKELTKKGKPADIDGFNYQQRFFLGWAQVWHMNMTEKELRKRIATDPHSPGKYRVIGPLANMKEFAEAFNCNEGDAMVNSDSTKALIW